MRCEPTAREQSQGEPEQAQHSATLSWSPRALQVRGLLPRGCEQIPNARRSRSRPNCGPLETEDLQFPPWEPISAVMKNVLKDGVPFDPSFEKKEGERRWFLQLHVKVPDSFRGEPYWTVEWQLELTSLPGETVISGISFNPNELFPNELFIDTEEPVSVYAWGDGKSPEATRHTFNLETKEFVF